MCIGRQPAENLHVVAAGRQAADEIIERCLGVRLSKAMNLGSTRGLFCDKKGGNRRVRVEVGGHDTFANASKKQTQYEVSEQPVKKATRNTRGTLRNRIMTGHVAVAFSSAGELQGVASSMCRSSGSGAGSFNGQQLAVAPWQHQEMGGGGQGRG